jgi:hypothetical protein
MKQITITCRRCGQEYTYCIDAVSPRPRWYCDECREIVTREINIVYLRKYRLRKKAEREAQA